MKIIQKDMMELYDKGIAVLENDPDFRYEIGGKSGKQVLRRVEYVIDKTDAMKALLGHPFILKSVEKLEGVNFIPTFDSMVLKAPDEGIIVKWHRDSVHQEDRKITLPLFNVDFYLDRADLKSCLWVIPGSNKWSNEQASERCKQPGFRTDDAVPVLMEAGDVIFHNILVLHGSPAGDGNDLRRTVYYEFRPGEVEAEFGPHTLEYLALKQQVLFDCIDRRKQTAYGAGEAAFEYKPQGAFKIAKVATPSEFRYPHKQYWRHE